MKWRVAIKKTDPITRKIWMPSPRDVVCKDHFLPEDYKETFLGL